MRAIVQRCLNASVVVEGQTVACIGQGIVLLVGVLGSDTEADMNYIVKKALHLKLWPSDEGKPWAKSLLDQGYELLVVSQFTLPICFKKGGLTTSNANRPDFHFAMSPVQAESMYDDLLAQCRQEHPQPEKVQAGVFGANMNVSLSNNGPVTVQLDSAYPRGMYDMPDPSALAQLETRARDAEELIKKLREELAVASVPQPLPDRP